MDIFKIIHKIRKLSIDDKINLAKKGVVIFTITVIVLAFILTGIKLVKNIFIPKNNEIADNTLDDSEPIETEDDNQNSGIKSEVASDEQKDDFKKYNCLQISNYTYKDNTVSFKVKNISDFTIKNVAFNLFNEKDEIVATILLDSKKKIKPNEEIVVEGNSSKKGIVKLYTFYKGEKAITINLENKSALTNENSDYSLYI